ncbi:amino acid/amide ABC transporter substrate-binding protein, HAAT family [Methanolobus vulcani]|uniref:Amino acid/amide ABC transporter substrate-binding protein, HAAT family n=1 Tax=Methanolobus vulcani TaxID=38026 RepID=A0A7Z7FBY8_9EURY|nr:penicillin-binding protein activator [Methanolobus vulcani]SDF44740.1 amino acid/amide ABC transporter substrate-binding protein, HAAT family [Methanolobus vulcani]
MKRTTFIFIGILLAAILLSGCAESTEKATSESEDITIGALLPLTGNLASIGEASQAALVVSAGNINDYFSGLGSGKNVEVVVKDTESNPETALEKLKELHDMGITIVIGPQSSSEAEAVLDYANENGITLLSTASTAPSLAIPDDNLFRLVPDDTKQGMVLAKFMNEEGTSAVIPIYVDDVWGNGLVDEIGANFEELNGTMIEGVAYDTETTNFSAEVESLNEKVVAATSEYEDGNVAVLICSYGEVTDIFALAQNYPALSDVDWYATDGIALNNELITDEDAAAFAATTNIKAAMYGYVRANDLYQVVGPEIEEELGRMPDSYALAAYDALWLATFVDLDSIPENDDSVKLAMKSLTNTYYGVSGWTILDENGDRKYWDYDVWTVNETDGTYQWELYGKVLLPYKNNMVVMRGEELTFA